MLDQLGRPATCGSRVQSPRKNESIITALWRSRTDRGPVASRAPERRRRSRRAKLAEEALARVGRKSGGRAGSERTHIARESQMTSVSALPCWR